MTNHTPGTWLAKDGEIYLEETGHTLARVACYGTEADAERIEACVNACAGMDDPQSWVEETNNAIMDHVHLSNELRTENEALRAALEQLLDADGDLDAMDFEQARAALEGVS